MILNEYNQKIRGLSDRMIEILRNEGVANMTSSILKYIYGYQIIPFISYMFVKLKFNQDLVMKKIQGNNMYLFLRNPNMESAKTKKL